MSTYHYSLSLRLRHPSMSPPDMSDALGLQPDRSWRAGEPRSTLKGAPLSGVNRESYWTALLGKGAWPPDSLVDAISAALDRLSGRRPFFHQIRSDGRSAEFFIGWFFDGQSGDVLPCGLMARAADLAIDLSFDVYPALMS